jgi:hypothetical protein
MTYPSLMSPNFISFHKVKTFIEMNVFLKCILSRNYKWFVTLIADGKSNDEQLDSRSQFSVSKGRNSDKSCTKLSQVKINSRFESIYIRGKTLGVLAKIVTCNTIKYLREIWLLLNLTSCREGALSDLGLGTWSS